MVAKTKNQNLDRLFSRKYTVVPRGPYSSSSSLCQRSVGQITGKHPLPFNQREDQTPTHYPQNKSSIDKALCEHYIHCQVAENSAKYLKRDRKKATNFGLEHFCLSFYLLFWKNTQFFGTANFLGFGKNFTRFVREAMMRPGNSAQVHKWGSWKIYIRVSWFSWNKKLILYNKIHFWYLFLCFCVLPFIRTTIFLVFTA